MKPELRNKLILALALAADVSDADLETALNAHLDKVIAEKEPPEMEDAPATGPPAANAKIAADLTAALTAANNQAASLRVLRAEVTLDSCIALGIITPASRETEKTALLAANTEESFASALDALRARKPVIRTAPSIASTVPQERHALLAANSDHGRAELRRQKIEEVIREITANRPRMAGDYERAASIAASRHQELFAY